MILSRALIAVATASVALAGTASAASAENVVDSKGVILGTVQGAPDAPWVRLKMKDGTWTAVRIGWHGYNTNQSNNPVFVTEGANCVGTKYIWGSLFNYAVSYKMKSADTKVYLRYPIPPYKTITVKSEAYWDSMQGKAVCFNRSTPYSTYVAVFKVIDTDTLGFTPPFTVK